MEKVSDRPEAIIEHSAVSSAAAVAADIRRRMPEAEGALLHRLLYIVQGMHLEWERRPAFDEDLEAWPQGPVVASLWHAEAGGRSRRPWEQLPESVHNVVTRVLCHQRDNGCTMLVEDIPEPDPWTRVTRGGRNAARQPISKRCLFEFFSIEHPQIAEMRAALDAELAAAGHDRHRPFVPSPPGALDALIEKYGLKGSL